MKKYIAAGTAFALFASGIAAAQTSPALSVNLYASPLVERNAQDTLLALFTLSARDSSSAIEVTSVPIVATFGNGASISHLGDCRVRDINALATPLNTGANAIGIVSGANTIPLDTAFRVDAGATKTLAITCDVASNTPLGSTIALSMSPSAFSAKAVGGTSITPTIGEDSNGNPGRIAGTATIVSDATPTTPTVPGVPNTGSDAAQNLGLLLMAGFVAVGGLLMARRFSANR